MNRDLETVNNFLTQNRQYSENIVVNKFYISGLQKFTSIDDRALHKKIYVVKN